MLQKWEQAPKWGQEKVNKKVNKNALFVMFALQAS
jgi:hypothetical protein